MLPHKEPNKKANKKIEDENAEKFVELINKLTKENLNTLTNPIPEIIDMLISVLEEETVFRKYFQLLKNKIDSLIENYNYENFRLIAIKTINDRGLSELFIFYCKDESKYEKEETEYYQEYARTLRYKLKLPPLPDEGIAGQEEKPEENNNEEKENNKETDIKTDEYFDFNIKNLTYNSSLINNLSILVFYLLEINEESKLEDYASKLINKITDLLEEKNIKQNNIQMDINQLLLNNIMVILRQYRHTYKQEKLTKFFIFPFVKNIDKNQAYELMNEFITKNIKNSKNISDIVKNNTLQFINNHNISPKQIKENFLKDKTGQAKIAYTNLLNKNFDWLF